MIKNILISLDQPVINLYFIFTFIVLRFTFAGIQDMLPQNMAPWHIEYLRLKELEKMEEAGRSLSPPCPSSLKPVMKLPCEGYSPRTRGREAFLLPEMGSLELRNPYKQTFLN